jgi:hypothetical protein
MKDRLMSMRGKALHVHEDGCPSFFCTGRGSIHHGRLLDSLSGN